MKMLIKFVELINTEMEVPTEFGTFHLLSTLFVVALCLICFLLRDCSDRTFRLCIGTIFSLMLVLEVAKQIGALVSVEDSKVIFDYNFNDFPFQLCSTPLYVLPLLSFLPDCKLRDFAAAYTMTFGLVGGVAVYLVPRSVYINRVFINVQTMIHHGLQIVSGVFVGAYYRRSVKPRFFLGGVTVFAVLFAIANLLNTVVYDAMVSRGLINSGDVFNMFYISPRADQTTPMFSEFFKGLDPVVYIAGYFVCLTVAAAILAYLAWGIYVISRKRHGLEVMTV